MRIPTWWPNASPCWTGWRWDTAGTMASQARLAAYPGAMVEGNTPGLALAERVAPSTTALQMSRRRARRRSTPTACGVEKRLWVWEASLHHTGETMRRKLRIEIIDPVSIGPTRALYARVMQANLASIMPQV